MCDGEQGAPQFTARLEVTTRRVAFSSFIEFEGTASTHNRPQWKHSGPFLIFFIIKMEFEDLEESQKNVIIT